MRKSTSVTQSDVSAAHDAGGLEDASRRRLIAAGLTGSLALAGVIAAGQARAEGEQDAHAGHDMSANKGHSAPAKHQVLADSAAKCIAKGESCIAHCISMNGTGDTSLKDCLRTVSLMLPMCTALLRAAYSDSPRLKAIAAACLDVCADCEKECKKHADHHAICKACAESCADCIAECKKVI